MRCKIITLLVVLALFTGIASAYGTNDLNSNGPEPLIKVAAATGESIVDNLDGTYTYTQTVDESSTAPHYTAPANGGGFGIYSWMDQDYGWMHTLDPTIYADPNLTINSVQIVIRAWDVDAEPEHGLEGEYDHVTADGVDMNPVYLQGTDDTWSTTTFDVNPSLLLNDGALDMWIDIDMYDTDSWATTLEYSKLIVTYSTDGSNHIPYEPVVEKSPAYCVDTNDNLVVDVTGPNPADPDGDAVTYKYRWYVDVGTGGYLDDDFALGIDHTGNTVPAADTSVGEKWMVQVTPVDAYGAQGPMVEVEFETIVRKCGEEEIPEFPTLVLPIAAIIGIALVFQRRKNE
jgi:hypothetical protein